MAGPDPYRRALETTCSYEYREALDPDRAARIAAAIRSDAFASIREAETAYFVLGNYDDGPRERRLELVRQILARRDGAHAFLMKDLPEAWAFWPTKFHVLAAQADVYVAVLEDTRGSHQWEFGYLAAPPAKDRICVLKREYDSRAVEHARFDALPAHLVDLLEQDDRVWRWETTRELRESTVEIPADTDPVRTGPSRG